MKKLSAALVAGCMAAALTVSAEPARQACAVCHGETGYSPDPDMPTIGGVSAYYLETAMLVYQDRGRSCPQIEYPPGADRSGSTTMCEIAGDLDEGQIQAVANYYAKQKFVPADQSVDAALVAAGAKLHQAYCSKCHTDNGGAAADDAGILAGQKLSYLAFVMQDYRDGKRPTLKKMQQSIDALSDGEVKALVHFYASQQ